MGGLKKKKKKKRIKKKEVKPNLPTPKIFALQRKTKVIWSLFESIFGDTLLWGDQRELRSRHIISLWQENYPMKSKCLYTVHQQGKCWNAWWRGLPRRRKKKTLNGCRQGPKQTPVRRKSKQPNDKSHCAGNMWPFLESVKQFSALMRHWDTFSVDLGNGTTQNPKKVGKLHVQTERLYCKFKLIPCISNKGERKKRQWDDWLKAQEKAGKPILHP